MAPRKKHRGSSKRSYLFYNGLETACGVVSHKTAVKMKRHIIYESHSKKKLLRMQAQLEHTKNWSVCIIKAANSFPLLQPEDTQLERPENKSDLNEHEEYYQISEASLQLQDCITKKHENMCEQVIEVETMIDNVFEPLFQYEVLRSERQENEDNINSSEDCTHESEACVQDCIATKENENMCEQVIEEETIVDDVSEPVFQHEYSRLKRQKNGGNIQVHENCYQVSKVCVQECIITNENENQCEQYTNVKRLIEEVSERQFQHEGKRSERQQNENNVSENNNCYQVLETCVQSYMATKVDKNTWKHFTNQNRKIDEVSEPLFQHNVTQSEGPEDDSNNKGYDDCHQVLETNVQDCITTKENENICEQVIEEETMAEDISESISQHEDSRFERQENEDNTQVNENCYQVSKVCIQECITLNKNENKCEQFTNVKRRIEEVSERQFEHEDKRSERQQNENNITENDNCSQVLETCVQNYMATKVNKNMYKHFTNQNKKTEEVSEPLFQHKGTQSKEPEDDSNIKGYDDCYQVLETNVQDFITTKYHLDSDDEPFVDDATDDEYIPDSFESDDSDSASELGHLRLGTFDANLRNVEKCKRKLEFEEVGTNSSSHSSKSQDFPLNSVSRSASSTPNDISYQADLCIGLDTAIVTMSTESFIHNGTYKCTLINEGQTLKGSLPLAPPGKNHSCIFSSKRSEVVVIIFREHVKPTLEVKIQVEYCFPGGVFNGKELRHKDVFVSPLLLLQGGSKRKINILDAKKHCCFYCERMYADISKHLERMHSKETEILEISKMEKRTKERSDALKKLRLLGDDRYNLRVSKNEKISIRRPTKRDVSLNITCHKCGGSMAPSNFARHERKCNESEIRPPNRMRVLPKARLLEKNRSNPNRLFSGLQEKFIDDLLQPLQVGLILHEIQSDKCLRLVTRRYALMHRNVPGALKNDRQNLRRLARLLLEIREIDSSVLDFEDCILSSNYDTLLEGIFKMCALDTTSGTFGKPALAQVMSSTITFLLNALKDNYIRKGVSKDTIAFKKLEDFMTLHKDNYTIFVGKSAGRTRLEKRAKTKNDLPSSRDVKLFSEYIITEAGKAYRGLIEDGFNYDTWLRLGKSVLAKIIVFNRRRVSEVSSMTIELYKNKTTLNEQQKSNLTTLERTLADSYQIMTLIGKRNHILHLLLDEDQCRYLDLFISYRKEAGVQDSNMYLFGIPTNTLYIDATHVLREFSFKCGAEDPSLLRTTYLRKQVATLAQLLTLNDNQIGQVAKLMGHTQKVHEDVYRQDENLFQVTCWAKFLTLASDTDIQKYKGKTFEEIVNVSQDLNDVDFEDQGDFLTVSELIGEEAGCASTSSGCDNIITDVRDEVEVEIPNETTDSNAKTPTSKATRTRRKLMTPRKSPKTATIAQIMNELQVSPPKLSARKRVSFTSKEVELMNNEFNKYIRLGQLAPFDKCRQIIEDNKNIFLGRCERDVYNWVQYQRNKFRSINSKKK